MTHKITGNIVDPGKVNPNGDSVNLCKGTAVRADVIDTMGTPKVTAKTSNIVCDATGCSVSS